MKGLPGSMTVGALKQLCARLFKCELPLTRLSVRDSPASYPCLMDEDLKTLTYYGVCDGCEVLVEEVDPRDLARQAEEQRALAQSRLDSQVRARRGVHSVHSVRESATLRCVTTLQGTWVQAHGALCAATCLLQRATTANPPYVLCG